VAAESLECLSYNGITSRTGNSQSTGVWICDAADVAEAKIAFFANGDGYDGTLTVIEVEPALYKNDPLCGKVQLTVKAIPTWKVANLLPNQPFRLSVEDADEAITKEGSFHWKTGGLSAPVEIKPYMRIAVERIVLTGCISAFTIDTYKNLVGRINSDEWQGAEIETLQFRPYQVQQRQDESGVIVYDVRLNLIWREVSWNKYWDPINNRWDELREDGTNLPVYTPTAFASQMPEIAS